MAQVVTVIISPFLTLTEHQKQVSENAGKQQRASFYIIAIDKVS